MIILLAILGFVLLVVGADLLVRGSVRLAAAAGISPLVVGLTVVALGTSAPELAVGIQSARAGQGDLTSCVSGKPQPIGVPATKDIHCNKQGDDRKIDSA